MHSKCVTYLQLENKSIISSISGNFGEIISQHLKALSVTYLPTCKRTDKGC